MDSIARIKNEAGSKWFDWKWQFSNRIRDLKSLQEMIQLSEAEEDIFKQSASLFTFGATPYYLSLIRKNDANCPVRKQIIPSATEFYFRGTEKDDPLEEESFTVVNGLVHRFQDRVLLYLSHQCGAYCRFCTRKRKVSDSATRPGIDDREAAFAYIENNPAIREVILSGGDPLTLSDGFLRDVLQRLRSIPHINQLRIHTRIPVVMPMRITDELCEIFKAQFPVYIVTHFNHVNEITEEAAAAVKKLITAGNCILLNQNVLLAGVNDNAGTLRDLYYRLAAIGIKPYYMHHCDEVKGISGFRVPYQKGLQIMAELRDSMSGICLPEFVVDLAGARGKMPLSGWLVDK